MKVSALPYTLPALVAVCYDWHVEKPPGRKMLEGWGTRVVGARGRGESTHCYEELP